MNIRKFLFLGSFFFFTFTACLGAREQELLKVQDVDKIMSQIFDQHVDKKEISTDILQNSLKVYIDQFDPERIYLLESEVAPYQNLSRAELSKMIVQYKKHNLEFYTKLNETIQNAILRSRKIRKEIESDPTKLFLSSNTHQLKVDDTHSTHAFASNEQELKTRLQDHIISIINAEKRRYGESYVTKNSGNALSAIEKQFHTTEDQYLFVDQEGSKLSNNEKENLFLLHVLKALANSLDAHTSFLDSNEAYDMRLRLEKGYQGVGVVLEKGPDGVTVKKMLKGSPAERSGLIYVKDLILQINGVKLGEMSLEEATNLIRNSKEKFITLVIKRSDSGKVDGEKILTVKLPTEKISLDEGRAKYTFEQFGNGIIGKITLNSFYQGSNDVTSEKDVAKAIKELDAKGNLRGLILDLRENSGGFLSQAVKVAGLFITNGVIVVSKYHNGEEVYYRDMDSSVAYQGPLIVLTSKATASAAEIVAQALQDYGVALVVGDEQTYGKGTIQSQTVTNDKSTSYFKVTVGKYYTVSGKTPQVHGVKSDIIVPGKFSNLEIGEEHLDYVLAEDKIEPSYHDELKDIDPNLKPWYLRYYMPTLQHRQYGLKNMSPLLKKNSEFRLSKNKDYQKFIEKLKVNEIDVTNPKDNFGSEDLQMAEAVNIMKDVILIESREHVEGIGKSNVALEKASKK